MDSIHILIWWCGICWNFLKQNEFLALWLEGLALVAIFIWDRIDAHAHTRKCWNSETFGEGKSMPTG